MLLKLTHTTDLTYTDLISESTMELRMAPRQEQDQHRLAFTLGIGPGAPALSYFDWLGNAVHSFTVNSFHRQIRIVATSVVETDRPEVDVRALPDGWPVCPTDCDYTVYDFLQFGGPIVDSPMLRDLVAQLTPNKGRGRLGELAMDMLRLINEKFTYRKGITNAASPITEVLQHGSGVCQDFTHLMIGMSRALGIPARYASGLLHPHPRPVEGASESDGGFRGASQTHAWCELLFPSTGWIGFDPANNCTVGESFVKVAVGRHFFDVPPNKGIYRGKAKESIDVAVHSEVLEEIPQELAAERVQSLEVPVFAEGMTPHRELASQQQEHQQQQEWWDRPFNHQQEQQQQQVRGMGSPPPAGQSRRRAKPRRRP
jgi:transglutaminase-like putative cysteine protease